MENTLSKLILKRPLAFFDIEATGISPRADRIVEICIIKLMPDNSRTTHTYRVNPQMPIPEEVVAIHGITDADVADCPVFQEIANELAELLENCDLGGYNITRFDIPMLTEEFIRAGKPIDLDKRSIVDVQRIFHRKEPRDLTAALSFYAGEEHTNAHGAEPDVIATIRVMEGQFEKYNDLPESVEDLHEYCNPRNPFWADRTGKLKWSNGEIVLNFGQRKGTSLKSLIQNDNNYIKWMLRSDFPIDVRELINNAKNGIWPEQPKR